MWVLGVLDPNNRKVSSYGMGGGGVGDQILDIYLTFVCLQVR